MPIDTEIKGNPESIRSAAGWTRDKLASGVADATDQVYSARNRANSADWSGEASGSFSEKMTSGARKGDDFAEAAKQAGLDLEDVAGELQKAQREMKAICEEATAAGLVVDGYTIEEPGSAPPSAGPAPTGEAATPAADKAHQAALDAEADHARKIDAYNKAKADADDVRRGWEQRVEELNNKAKGAAGQGWFSVGDIAQSTAAASAAYAKSSKLLTQASSYVDDANRAISKMDTLAARNASGLRGLVDAVRVGNLAAKADISIGKAEGAAANAKKAEKAGGRIGLKVGGALAVAGVAYEIIATDKDPVQATVSGAAGFGASVATGLGVGAVIGGPVGAGIGAVAGAAFGVFTSGMVDSMWENGVENVGGAIEDGAQAVVDAGGAVVDGVSDAFDAIF